MRTRGTSQAMVQVQVGFAGGDGRGIAYARLLSGSARRVMRIEFTVGRAQGSVAHGVAYAALTAVARALTRRAITRAGFVLNDGDFVREIETGRDIGEALALPYVRLRCALNALDECSLATGPTDDLTQRALAEIALNIAA